MSFQELAQNTVLSVSISALGSGCLMLPDANFQKDRDFHQEVQSLLWYYSARAL